MFVNKDFNIVRILVTSLHYYNEHLYGYIVYMVHKCSRINNNNNYNIALMKKLSILKGFMGVEIICKDSHYTVFYPTKVVEPKSVL